MSVQMQYHRNCGGPLQVAAESGQLSIFCGWCLKTWALDVPECFEPVNDWRAGDLSFSRTAKTQRHTPPRPTPGKVLKFQTGG